MRVKNYLSNLPNFLITTTQKKFPSAKFSCQQKGLECAELNESFHGDSQSCRRELSALCDVKGGPYGEKHGPSGRNNRRQELEGFFDCAISPLIGAIRAPPGDRVSPSFLLCTCVPQERNQAQKNSTSSVATLPPHTHPTMGTRGRLGKSSRGRSWGRRGDIV